MIRVKRVYDPPEAADGTRLLVDRLWPRGVSREKLKMAAWLKDAAPSNALRKRFGHDPAQWPEFQRAYAEELDSHPESWQPILEAASRGAVTLLFAARDVQRNNAIALKHYLDGKLK